MSGRPIKRMLEGDGVRLAADCYGEPSARTIIFAHGGGQSRTAWRGAARAAAEEGYYAVSLDLRGHGDSEWSPEGDYHFASYVRDFAAIIPSLGGKAALVGASLGGRVALLMCTSHPDMVGALALADVTPRIDEDVADDMREFFHRSAQGFATIEEAAQTLAALTEDKTPSPAVRLLPHLREQDGRFHWRWDPRFVQGRFVAESGQLQLLEDSARALKTPTIVIRAELSTVVRAEHVEEFKRTSPHIETRVAPGIGHMLTGDANDAYAPMLIEFFKRTYPP